MGCKYKIFSAKEQAPAPLIELFSLGVKEYLCLIVLKDRIKFTIFAP